MVIRKYKLKPLHFNTLIKKSKTKGLTIPNVGENVEQLVEI